MNVSLCLYHKQKEHEDNQKAAYDIFFVVSYVLRANFCRIGLNIVINSSIKALSIKQSLFLGQNILQSDFELEGSIFWGMTKIM